MTQAQKTCSGHPYLVQTCPLGNFPLLVRHRWRIFTQAADLQPYSPTGIFIRQ